MGTLNGEHIIEKLESNGLNHSTNLVEEEATISDIQDSVKILLQGLGEDSNREGLIKTPLRVAKALREGTRVKTRVEGRRLSTQSHTLAGHMVLLRLVENKAVNFIQIYVAYSSYAGKNMVEKVAV